jgi:hypothetical protein
MTLETFLSILADACQFHEGYTSTSASYLNNNPGNLRFAHQNGATATPANFAKFPTFYQGKQAQIKQLAIDVAKYNAIDVHINSYAPPSENDTQAYISIVLQFFAWRNIAITATEPIDQFLASFSKPIVLTVFDNMTSPEDWHANQQAVSQCASYMGN